AIPKETSWNFNRARNARLSDRLPVGEALSLHPNAGKITGVVCGVRLEDLEDPLMRKIRYLDKLIDELATGRPMVKILRA
ncbi:MAG: DUF2200 family protein, partial [Vicinamibacterales bacterium]